MTSNDETGDVTIVGSSHISKESVDVIEGTIKEEQPDVVAVELDEQRKEAMMEGKQSMSLEDMDSLRDQNIFKMLLIWVLSFFQNKMAEKVGIEPGADMKAAIETAEEEEIDTALIDRNINITLTRLLERLGILEKLRMIALTFYGFFKLIYLAVFKGLTEDDLDTMDYSKHPDKEEIDKLMGKLRKISPTAGKVFVDERDIYMAVEIDRLRNQGKDVVAVVGAGHRSGIEEHLENFKNNEQSSQNNNQTQETLNEVKEKNDTKISKGKLFGYTITIGVLLLFFFLIMGGASNTLVLTIAVSWVLVNGIPTFILSKALGSSWRGALTGFSLAWLTSINPSLAPGWFVGYVELKYRNDIKSTDIEDINELIKDPPGDFIPTFRELAEIPLFNFILIVAAANIGSLIGTVAFLFIILPYIGADFELWNIIVQGFYNTIEILS